MMQKLIELVEKIGPAYKAARKKIVTVESCTGGGLSFWLTALSGSSEWFDRGFVTYTNQAKMDMVGVAQSTLDQFGAVSKETAIAMAEGGLNHSQGDVCVAITGIAGPGGGSPHKPVGTVWLGWAQKGNTTSAECFLFDGERTEVREQTLQQALEKLLDIVCKV